MRIGDLGSSFAFALPLEVQSLTFTRSQGHGRGEGLESVLSWSLFSYFKHVTFEIFTQLHRLNRVTIAIYLSRWQPHAWLSGWCSFHCSGLCPPKKGHEWQRPIRNQRRFRHETTDATWAFRHHLIQQAWEPGLGSADTILALTRVHRLYLRGMRGLWVPCSPWLISLWISHLLAHSGTSK